MFTGIIQDIGKIERLRRSGDNIEFTILSDKLTRDINIGDSICISGVCLTATAIDARAKQFTVTAVSETLERSTLSDLKHSDLVNLELALQPTARLGGHFVQGHIDTVGKCAAIQQRAGSWELRFEFSREYERYVVEKGSIAIDGVSLTTYDIKPLRFSVSIVPHTWAETTLRLLKPGTRANLEFDLIGKYVAKMLGSQRADAITPEKLREYGY
jgi:riboflavin synthase